ncbi:MAG: hypothetical protein C0501_21940 [Isosphaera sp.]|nr:hypothetical protein [Isosphaera sp.]
MRSLTLAALLVAAPAAAEDKKPEVRAKLDGHRGAATAVAFSRKGDLLATGAGNGVVRVWDAKTGKELAKLDEHKGEKITHVAFSANGKLLSAVAKTGFVVWDAAKPDKPAVAFKELKEKELGYHGTVSGNGKRFYFASGTKQPTGMVSTTTGQPIINYRWELAYYDPESKETKTVFAHAYPDATVAVICAIPDEESAMVAVGGRSVGFYGIGDYRGLGDTGGANRLEFSPDGRWFCTSGSAASAPVLCWKVPGSQIVEGPPREVMPYNRAGLAAPGPNDLLAYTNHPRVGEVTSFTVLRIADKPETVASFVAGIKEVSCLAFSPDGKTLAVGNTADGTVELWTIDLPKK